MASADGRSRDLSPADTSLSTADPLVHSLTYDLDRPVVTFNDSGRVVTAREYRDVISRYAQALDSLGLAKGALLSFRQIVKHGSSKNSHSPAPPAARQPTSPGAKRREV